VNGWVAAERGALFAFSSANAAKSFRSSDSVTLRTVAMIIFIFA
jgi:hypothetical protein